MFLRCKVRRKDGKQHRYWSVVENTRTARGRVVQRHVLYLGEINDTQELAWRRSIEVLEEGATQPRTLSLFPEDRLAGALADASIVHVKLSLLQLRRPRQWGACWLALLLWRELQLDQFWSKRLGSEEVRFAPISFLHALTFAGFCELVGRARSRPAATSHPVPVRPLICHNRLLPGQINHDTRQLRNQIFRYIIIAAPLPR
jgi:hypothetical protein